MTTKHRALIVYFSHSSQTRKLLQAFAAGLAESGVDVGWQQLKTTRKLPFPLGSVWSTIIMMVETFFHRRYEIEPLDQQDFDGWDVVILAGPTWSYSPCGPVFSFFDRYGMLLSGKTVIPFISCRGYWRMHYFQLRLMLARRKAVTLQPIIFLHTGAEPWRTIGVFLKLAGKAPDLGRSWIGRYYTRFGHTREQVDLAQRLGAEYGVALKRQELEQMKTVVIKDVEPGRD
ncbi:NAD(P)H-dependent oxidoreductase [Desulfopila inferna]|uniref:NAD(P)H-dependent oxidoreductase n=1 Tax=Desulfopila inferna TaxID=468528 RepID=UPI001964116E|nr:NAD(P)H-dependent oxidoreductase [Desulfopila inferna]